MKKSKLFKRGLCTLFIAALCLFPLAYKAHAASPAAAPTTVTQAEDAAAQKARNSRLLGWGVFGIAVGEVGGLIGRGLASVHQEKRKARRAAMAPVVPQPLAYELYRNKTGDIVA